MSKQQRSIRGGDNSTDSNSDKSMNTNFCKNMDRPVTETKQQFYIDFFFARKHLFLS